ncbi:hypothetical protein VT06_15365 [Arsukibacterium sp. MJ3]|nr:hypothetical protein VT06_15365 [Arsukibacterium sp. MJ3]
MSIDSGRIVCTGCDYKTLEMYRPILIRYQTKNGKTIETGRAKGWCFGCASYSDIEQIDQVELREELVSKKRERLKTHYRQNKLSSGLLSIFRYRPEKRQLKSKLMRLDNEIDNLGEWLKILENRKSKARCLKCWSDRTAPLTFNTESNIVCNFRHECGGHLQIINDHSGPRFIFRVSTYVLSEEGEFLGRE